MSEKPDRARAAPAIGAGIVYLLLLCWPALLNGGAFFFPDTSAYLRAADTALYETAGWKSEWSDKHHLYVNFPGAPATRGDAAAQPSGRSVDTPLHPVLLGRSIYYGLVVLPLVVWIGSIGAALVQAACVILTIRLTLSAFVADRSKIPLRMLVAVLLLSAFTSVPFFVSLLMPDLFTGITVILGIAISFGWTRYRTWERVSAALLLSFCALAHSGNILLLFLLAGAVGLLRLRSPSIWSWSPAMILFAALAGLLAEGAFVSAVSSRTGEAPVRPPFLTARLIAAGPGQQLLEDRCAQLSFVVCRYTSRGPQDSDTFLWSDDPATGVFSTESRAVQKKLASEDLRFALATFRYRPVQVLRACAEASAKQLFMMRLDIFNAPSQPATLIENLPPQQAEEVRASRYASQSMPVALAEIISTASAAVAAVLLALLAMGKAGTGERASRATRFAACLLLFGMAANAAITGSLSKPHNRYNARITWILPLGAFILLSRRRPSTGNTEEKYGTE